MSNNKPFLDWHEKQLVSYEGKVFKRLRDALKKPMRTVADSVARHDFKTDRDIELVLYANYTNEVFLNALVDVMLLIAIEHGVKVEKFLQIEVGKMMQAKALAVPKPLSSEWWASVLRDIILREAGTKIVSMRKSLIEAAISWIANKVGKEGQSYSQVVTAMADDFGKREGFYRWQLLRIARTEANGAANLGSYEAMRNSSLVVDKQWLAAKDERTRTELRGEFGHLQMDGVKLPLDEKFIFFNSEDGDFDAILYPSDPKGAAANVINCRCTIVAVPRRDANGLLMLKADNPNADLPKQEQFSAARVREILHINDIQKSELMNNSKYPEYLTLTEREALRRYTGGDYIGINNWVAGKPIKDIKWRYKNFYIDEPENQALYWRTLNNELIKATNKLKANQDVSFYQSDGWEVFRGAKMNKLKYEKLINEMERLVGLEDEVLEYPVWMSTSRVRRVAYEWADFGMDFFPDSATDYRVLFEITDEWGRAAAEILDISEVKREREHLYSPLTKFFVTGFERQEGDKILVKLKVYRP